MKFPDLPEWLAQTLSRILPQSKTWRLLMFSIVFFAFGFTAYMEWVNLLP
ncbi:MAG: hypothetical protein AAGF53_18335 [Pseudomonadota bacterium]